MNKSVINEITPLQNRNTGLTLSHLFFFLIQEQHFKISAHIDELMCDYMADSADQQFSSWSSGRHVML